MIMKIITGKFVKLKSINPLNNCGDYSVCQVYNREGQALYRECYWNADLEKGVIVE